MNEKAKEIISFYYLNGKFLVISKSKLNNVCVSGAFAYWVTWDFWHIDNLICYGWNNCCITKLSHKKQLFMYIYNHVTIRPRKTVSNFGLQEITKTTLFNFHL